MLDLKIKSNTLLFNEHRYETLTIHNRWTEYHYHQHPYMDNRRLPSISTIVYSI